LLMWNVARTSPMVLTAVAVVVVIGNFVDRLRLYVPAWAVTTQLPEEHLSEPIGALPFPGAIEIVTCVGILALVALVLLRVPMAATWETKAVGRLVRERRLLRTRVTVVARPS